MLDVRHLTKVYPDGTVALKDVSFQVPDGAFQVSVGLSGSAKSTLLRCINRLIEPTEGEILWDGVDLAKLKGEELRRARRQIGMVFQQFNPAKRSKVVTNVLAGRLGYTSGWRSLTQGFGTARRQQAREAMARLGITAPALKRGEELSGG